jgi:MFS family permease
MVDPLRPDGRASNEWAARALRRLWFARALSATGDALTLVAVMVRVTGAHAGGTVLALLLLAEMAPNFASPLVGVLSDRLDRRRFSSPASSPKG